MIIAKKLCLLILVMIGTLNIHAQTHIGSIAPTNPDAILEITAANKGMLLPRIALTMTTSPTPLGNFVAGMTLYNTATAGDVVPGIYYSDGSKWIRINNSIRKAYYTATQGQQNFSTPGGITDVNNITLYRNGILIRCTVANVNTITAEVACDAGDEVKIIQQF